MDWPFVLFALEEGTSGLVLLGIALVAAFVAAAPSRKLVACSPGLAACFAFFASSLLAGVPNIEHATVAEYVPIVGLLATIALLVPSILALRNKWLGALHVLTVAAALYLVFIAG